MLPYLAALLLAANPVAVELPTERVDLIERNAYYDEKGVLLLNQALFYEWDAFTERYQIRAWRLIKGPANDPRPCDEGYEMVWTEGGACRRVVAPKFRETWTQFDPEIVERKHLPADLRKGIFGEKKPQPEGNDPLPPAPETR